MNDQSQMMNKMNPVQSQMMNQNPVQMAMNPMNQPPPPPLPHVLNPVQPLMMNRSFKPWQQLQQQQQQQQLPVFNKNRSSNWKGKKVNSSDKRKDSRRNDNNNNNNNNNNKPNPKNMLNPSLNTNSSGSSTLGYNPPTLHELQSQNRLKARKFYPKKKFNNRFAPYAPRNTTSFIIRAKKAGGIASLVSPCPVTPAVLPTPIFSPSREVLGDMAKEEWGVDGYGSMKGLIRLRSPGHEEEEDDGNGSSESDVEEHVEVERRLDHDLSRFEMIYPSYGGVGGEYNNVLENRVDDQDSHIAQLEEENLTLKERLFLMERELGDLRRRMQFLERQSRVVVDVNEEVVENESENDSDGGSDVRGDTNNNNEYVSRNVVDVDVDVKEVINDGVGDVCMVEIVFVMEDESKDGEAVNVGNEIVSDNKLVAANDDDDESKGEEEAGNQMVDNESKGEEAGNVFEEEAGNQMVDNESKGEEAGNVFEQH